ncbi:MAG: VanZ family protein [Gemmatimonadota bacterium]
MPRILPAGDDSRSVEAIISELARVSVTAAHARRRLGLVLASYVIVLTLVMTLLPFDFQSPDRWRMVGYAGIQDLIVNLALFIPIGFFCRFARIGREDRWAMAALFGGLALSGVIELLQVFEPVRSPSLLDVGLNGLGAWAGAFLYDAARRALDQQERRIGVLALDLPLVGMLYLLIPLLWLAGLTRPDGPGGGVLELLPGFTGAVIFAAIDRHHLRAERRIPWWAAPAAASAWFALGIVPTWRGSPSALVAAILGLGIVTALFSRILFEVDPANRRYERVTLGRALPSLIVYIGLLHLWPLEQLSWSWTARFAFNPTASRLSDLPILSLIGLISAFSVLGYAIAEARGRRGESTMVGSINVLGLGLLGATLLGAARGFHPLYGLSVAEVLLAAPATMVGAAVYWLTRGYVRSLVKERELVAALGDATAPVTVSSPGRAVPTGYHSADTARQLTHRISR